SKREAIVFAVVAVVALAALAVVAYHAVFSSFFEYDDEGELLLYLRDYGSGTHLYNTMYSEYGPGYFALLSPLFQIPAIDITHDSGRFLTLGLWLAASGLCGVALFRLSGSALIGIAGLVLSFILLGILGAGQLHPVTPISFLLAAMVCVMAVLLPFRPGIA